MSGWDKDVAVLRDEAGAQAISAKLMAAGVSNIISRQPDVGPQTQASYHVKVQAKNLTIARLALWYAGRDSLEGGPLFPQA
jgi:hypothetical protein